MRIPRIHTMQVLSCGTSIELEPGSARHVARALRLSAGQQLILFNGDGLEYPSHIESVDRKRVTVLIGESRSGIAESPLNIHLGIAVSRGERMDFAVQKATELGANRIAPLFTERTEVRLENERAEKKLRHWRQIAISACEQCGRNTLPDIDPPGSLQDWLAATRAERKYVLHHRADDASSTLEKPTSVAILVGPEGGLGATEIAAAEQAGYQPLTLGPRVLRTETAPLAAIAILQARWGDMR